MTRVHAGAAAPTGEVRVEVIRRPKALPAAQREALFTALYAVHGQIFAGVDPATFRRYVFDPPGDACTLYVYRSEGDVIGYLAVHHVRCRIQGRRAIVLRGAAGMLPAFRGRMMFGGALARTIIGWRLRYPLHRMYGFLTPVSPAMYASAQRALVEYWPRPDMPTPAAVQTEMHALAERFQLAPEEPGRPGVRHVGWCVREPGRCDRSDPAVAFYLDHNPDFQQGYGLTLLCPMHLRNIVNGLRRVFRKRLRRLGFGRRRARQITVDGSELAAFGSEAGAERRV